MQKMKSFLTFPCQELSVFTYLSDAIEFFKFTSIMALAICSSLGEVTVTSFENDVTWEVTVTPNDMAICSSLQVTVTCENFQNFFFTLNDVKLPKMAKFSKKKFSKILRCDGHLKWRHSKWPWPSARHFKVTVTFERVTVTSLKWRADGQSHCFYTRVSIASSLFAT